MKDVIKYRVQFHESERGWGSETWNVDFDTEIQALTAVKDRNKENPETFVPDYYIVANYVGPVVVRVED